MALSLNMDDAVRGSTSLAQTLLLNVKKDLVLEICLCCTGKVSYVVVSILL